MTNTSSWTFQYLLVAIVALFAGPILSKWPGAQSFPLMLFGLSSAHTIRLIIEGTGVTMLGFLSIRAFRQMPDNGRGFSFLRQLVLPVTTLLIVIVVDKTLKAVGPSMITQLGPARYSLTYAGILTLSGIWITAAWLLNRDALNRFFSKPSPSTRRKETAAPIEEPHEVHPEEESGEGRTHDRSPRCAERTACHARPIQGPEGVGARINGSGLPWKRSDDPTVRGDQNDATERNRRY
ncbi:MAG: hypothetical protein HC938_01670 [Nitrospira sp.]|nr:hypothetical protein [Nitrospira sp.]